MQHEGLKWSPHPLASLTLGRPVCLLPVSQEGKTPEDIARDNDELAAWEAAMSRVRSTQESAAASAVEQAPGSDHIIVVFRSICHMCIHTYVHTHKGNTIVYSKLMRACHLFANRNSSRRRKRSKRPRRARS